MVRRHPRSTRTYTLVPYTTLFRSALPEIRIGLMPGAGGTQRLPRLVGKHRALDLLLTGAELSAAEAYSLGAVSRLVADDDVDAEALRSEEHTSELQSLMRISYAVLCLKKKTILLSTSQTRLN